MTGSPSFVPSCLRVSDVLEQHFDTAFASPDSIAKLRELILTLAMQGKLVEQDANDPPASELLKEIEAEKERVSHEGTKTRRKEKKLSPITPDEVPYQLPQGWEWVRLGDICSYIQRGKGPKYVDFSSHRVISQKCVRWYGLDLEPARYIDPASLAKYEPIRFLRVGDLLWNSTGTGTIGRACLVPHNLEGVEIVADSHVTVVRSIEVRPVFLWRWIQSPTVQNEIEGSASGTTNQIELNTSTVINHLMPLPPLPEQHRIVARIDQLMARCDALEKLRKEREEKRLAVHAAAIKQLLAPSLRAFVPSCETKEPFAFLAQHFGELYTVKENVAELRKAILQLAVMGRLVPQDPNDPPASELLKEIEAKKERASHEDTKTRRGNASQTVRLKDIASKIGSGATPSGGKNAYKNSGIPLIRSMNVHFEGFRKEGLAFIDESQAEKLKNVIVKESDVLLNITGASIGRVTIAPKEMELARVNQHVCIIRVIEKVLPKYLEIYLASPIFQEFVRSNQVGATREALTKSMIEEYEILLPPLPEQHRIVARIDQLMALCDTLDQQIDAATGKQAEILNAVMAAV